MNKRKKVVLIFIGSVGSGKGTQTKLLATKLNFPIISPGKLLRQEMEKKTEIGLKIEKRMDTGHLIDNHIVEAIIEKRLEKTDTKKGIIFDGFPRNIKQIASLKKWFNNFDKEQYNIWVVFIHITDKESRQRLSLRRSCPSCGQIFHLVYNPPKKKNTCDVCGHKLTIRPDDRPEVITDRLKTYHKENEPIVEYFADKKMLIRIDGEQKIEKIQKDIQKELKKENIE